MSKKIQMLVAAIFIISGIVLATIANPHVSGTSAADPTPTPRKKVTPTVSPTVSPTPAPTAEPDEPPNPTPKPSPTPTISV